MLYTHLHAHAHHSHLTCPSPPTLHSLPSSQAEQCSYDAKGGFCPRMPLCKLEHTSLLSKRPTKKQQLTLDTLSGHLGSPKHPHIDQPPSYGHLFQGAQEGLLLGPRSVSSPFPFHVVQPAVMFEKREHLQSVEQKGDEPSARVATPTAPAPVVAPKAESREGNGSAHQRAQCKASTMDTNEGPSQQIHASSNDQGAVPTPMEPSTSQSQRPASEDVSLGTPITSSQNQGSEQMLSTLQTVP